MVAHIRIEGYQEINSLKMPIPFTQPKQLKELKEDQIPNLTNTVFLDT